jgi:hypothetical protein
LRVVDFNKANPDASAVAGHHGDVVARRDTRILLFARSIFSKRKRIVKRYCYFGGETALDYCTPTGAGSLPPNAGFAESAS